MVEIFSANHQAMWINIGVSAFGLLFVAGVFWWIARRANNKIRVTYRQLLQMLMGFLGVTLVGIIVFSAFTINKLQPVTIEGNQLSTPYGDCLLEEINLAEIRANASNGLINKQYSDYLIIETAKQQAFVLTADHYDIQAILAKIKERVKEKE